jgi:hypothetical protein
LKQIVNRYADKISRNSATWGGHLEIVAAATQFNVNIVIVSDNEKNEIVSPLVNIEGEKNNTARKTWTIVYWKHKFALGAHYESTVPGVAVASSAPSAIAKKENENDDDDEESDGE